MKKYIFCSAFIVAALFQAFGWLQFIALDGGLWANEAKYVQTGSNRTEEFNFLGAYGHPGGPVIEGTIALNAISAPFYTDINDAYYDNALNAFIILFDALIIACICALCYTLSNDHLWWIIALFTLSLNGLYYNLTPPSAVAALLFVLFSLITLYIYKKAETSNKDLIIWAFIGGLLVSTRTDIGSVTMFAYGILLLQKVNWRKMVQMLVIAIGVFWFFDPFMWFMPIQHIKDLVYKVTFHYADISPTFITLHGLLSISGLAFVSMGIAIGFLLFEKKGEVTSFFPPLYMCTILILTTILYNIFTTAQEQAIRYFVPLIFLWETFLPLFGIYLISYASVRYGKTEERRKEIVKNGRAIIALVFISFPLLSFLNSIVTSVHFSIFR